MDVKQLKYILEKYPDDMIIALKTNQHDRMGRWIDITEVNEVEVFETPQRNNDKYEILISLQGKEVLLIS